MASAPGAAPQPAPWESVPAHEQLFVLITGANSGIGLGVGQRLIDEFLATRSLTSHLILLPTTRSKSKSLQTIRALRAHAEQAAKTSTALQSRARAGYSWRDTTARIHVLSLQVDLCDLRGVYAFADGLCRGTVSNPEGLEGEYLRNVRIPRLDTVVLNAAYGGWTGCNYPLAVWTMLTQGLVQSVTLPIFKNALPTRILNEQRGYNYPEKPLLGEVFCACVFGHYVLSHQLLPLLSRRRRCSQTAEAPPPGRIVWTSSVEAVRDVFDLADVQCFAKPIAYESAKRLTDILALTYTLPSVRPLSTRYLRMDEESGGSGGGGCDSDDDDTLADETTTTTIPPKIYLTHPGVVASALFPVPWFFYWAYELALVVARWLGSPWHTVDAYSGSKSVAWIALQDQPALDDMRAERVKWGSSSNRRLEDDVKRTEVEGWGWEGEPETDETIAADTAAGVLHKAVGRKLGTKNATREDIAEFEELGAKCWEEMERMRHQWAKILAEEEK